SNTVTASTANGATPVTFYITTVPFPSGATPGVSINVAPASTVQPGTVVTGKAGSVGQPSQFIVSVIAPTGQPIPNVGLTLNNGGQDPTKFPSATCQERSTVLTDSSGTAICTVLLGPVAGTATITPVVGYSSPFNPFLVTVSPATPSSVTIT